MKQQFVILHRILVALAAAILGASLVFFLIRWGSLPEEAGIHFGPDGSFDVYASRWYGFYPHIVGGLMIGGLTFASWLARRKPTGLHVTETGERLFRTELTMTLDVISLLVGVGFGYWSRCVSLQVPLNDRVMGTLVSCMLFAAAVGILAEIITCMIHRSSQPKPEKQNSLHRISTLVAWLVSVSGLLVLAVVWDRIHASEDSVVVETVVYAANLNRCVPKPLVLIPYAVNALLLIGLWIVGKRAGKQGNPALLALTDKLRIVVAIWFFFWGLEFISEIPVGIVSVLLFVGLCALFTVQYLTRRKKETE